MGEESTTKKKVDKDKGKKRISGTLKDADDAAMSSGGAELLSDAELHAFLSDDDDFDAAPFNTADGALSLSEEEEPRTSDLFNDDDDEDEEDEETAERSERTRGTSTTKKTSNVVHKGGEKDTRKAKKTKKSTTKKKVDKAKRSQSISETLEEEDGAAMSSDGAEMPPDAELHAFPSDNDNVDVAPEENQEKEEYREETAKESKGSTKAATTIKKTSGAVKSIKKKKKKKNTKPEATEAMGSLASSLKKSSSGKAKKSSKPKKGDSDVGVPDNSKPPQALLEKNTAPRTKDQLEGTESAPVEEEESSFCSKKVAATDTTATTDNSPLSRYRKQANNNRSTTPPKSWSTNSSTPRPTDTAPLNETDPLTKKTSKAVAKERRQAAATIGVSTTEDAPTLTAAKFDMPITEVEQKTKAVKKASRTARTATPPIEDAPMAGECGAPSPSSSITELEKNAKNAVAIAVASDKKAAALSQNSREEQEKVANSLLNSKKVRQDVSEKEGNAASSESRKKTTKKQKRALKVDVGPQDQGVAANSKLPAHHTNSIGKTTGISLSEGAPTPTAVKLNSAIIDAEKKIRAAKKANRVASPTATKEDRPSSCSSSIDELEKKANPSVAAAASDKEMVALSPISREEQEKAANSLLSGKNSNKDVSKKKSRVASSESRKNTTKKKKKALEVDVEAQDQLVAAASVAKSSNKPTDLQSPTRAPVHHTDFIGTYLSSPTTGGEKEPMISAVSLWALSPTAHQLTTPPTPLVITSPVSSTSGSGPAVSPLVANALGDTLRGDLKETKKGGRGASSSSSFFTAHATTQDMAAKAIAAAGASMAQSKLMSPRANEAPKHH